MSPAKTLTGQKGAEAVIKAAWILMPKQMMNERPYVITASRAQIDWRLVELQRNRWYKLPK